VTQLATALKTQRRLVGVKQTELADIIGCSQQLIGRWEKGAGTPGTQYIRALANFLDVDAEEVLRMAFAGDEDANEIEARLDEQEAALAALGEEFAHLRLTFSHLQEMLELLVAEDERDLTAPNEQ
jgi:transcriptional regulator with XRE-family HTH domain